MGSLYDQMEARKKTLPPAARHKLSGRLRPLTNALDNAFSFFDDEKKVRAGAFARFEAEATGADAAMSSEGALEDPTIFSGARAPPLDLADQYLALAEENSPVLADARGHFHKLLFELVQAPGRETFRSRLVEAKDWAAFKAILADLRADAGAEEAARPRDPKLSWYRRHRRAAADAAARADADAAEAARRRADPTDNEDAGVAGLFGGGDDDDY